MEYHAGNGLVYGFSAGGNIDTIDTTTGAAVLAAQPGQAFWGATTNPARWR